MSNFNISPLEDFIINGVFRYSEMTESMKGLKKCLTDNSFTKDGVIPNDKLNITQYKNVNTGIYLTLGDFYFHKKPRKRQNNNLSNCHLYLTKNNKLIDAVTFLSDDTEKLQSTIIKIIQFVDLLQSAGFEVSTKEDKNHFVHPTLDLDARFTNNQKTFELEVTIIQSIYKKHILSGTEQDKQTLDNIILSNKDNPRQNYLMEKQPSLDNTDNLRAKHVKKKPPSLDKKDNLKAKHVKKKPPSYSSVIRSYAIEPFNSIFKRLD